MILIKKADVVYKTKKIMVINIELSNEDKIEAIVYTDRAGPAHYIKTTNKKQNS